MKAFPWIGPKSKKGPKCSEMPCFIESEVSTKMAKSVSFDRTYRKPSGPIEGNTLYFGVGEGIRAGAD